MSKRMVIACEELRQLYVTEGWTMAQIALHLGCCAATVSHHLRACGIAPRSGRFPTSKITPEVMLRLYSEEQLPIAVIAAQLGVSIGTVHNRRRAYGLTPRRERRNPYPFVIRSNKKPIREQRAFFVWV
ncbi:MAG: hypothetical protein EI684_09770 [Candidatus Viridilinea halotolerans]|uniref:Uncharacterized protein n=1 Tax=Candidatus Viridilinea halotolerans TaxID=2491704 RepID=A0A426U0U2_9CHLR|nr:MAG: hypothetical protein EI684_09770 [Candidatus Viridilinea halotolerans]